VNLADHPTAPSGELADEDAARASIDRDTEALARYQDILTAHGRYAVLVLFQGMDAAGKDETIKKVMSSVDPKGSRAATFKELTETDLRHDYLRRYVEALPERGQIGIFNRSYYEQVITDRVHPEKLEEQELPDEACEPDIWQQRYRQINDFERYLVENGIRVLKFFFHISKECQRQRLLKRISDPKLQWQFAPSDLEDRERWDSFMEYYGEMLGSTSTEWAPWYLIPGDERWFEYASVASIIVETMNSLHSDYPETDPDTLQEIEEARKKLEAESR
jgi:PPK2 family polyphosphate:nucleotide phosphotransferase